MPTTSSSAPALYVLDSSIFIEASKRYYHFKVCPGFWASMLWQQEQGAIISIDRVKAELEKKDDALKAWSCTSMPEACFQPTDVEEVAEAYQQAMQWAFTQDFTQAAKAEFAEEKNADAWVIAYAKAFNCVVATEEKSNPGRKGRIMIPQACIALGVSYVDTFEMLKSLSVQFSWQAP